MRLLLTVLTVFLSSSSGTAASVEGLIRQGAAEEKSMRPAEALKFFIEADAARPNDPSILQKIARQYSDQVPAQSSDAAKREFATHALHYAKRATSLDPDNAVNVLSLAICYGHLALISGTREKVEYSRLIKLESERALALDPNYAWGHHLLGRWHGEVASFGGGARFFAKLLYGGIPPASMETGYRHLRRATELEPEEPAHWIELGFACAATGRVEEARASWTRGLAMPDTSPHDATSKRKALAELADLK